MNLITFSFEVPETSQDNFIDLVEETKSFWDGQGFSVSLFRDASRKTRFFQTFLTEKTVDDFSAFIQSHPEAKAVFEKIKESTHRVVVSFMEQVV